MYMQHIDVLRDMMMTLKGERPRQWLLAIATKVRFEMLDCDKGLTGNILSPNPAWVMRCT